MRKYKHMSYKICRRFFYPEANPSRVLFDTLKGILSEQGKSR